QDLERLADHFKNKYGFQCYQIAIHRDEGHIDDAGREQINQHAHLEFITLDEKTGRSLYRKINKGALRQIQTEVADILGMQRGEDVRKSGAKRIEPRAYGKLMNEVRQKHNAEKQELKAEKDNALKELETSKDLFYKTGKALSTLYDSGLFTQQDKDGLPPLNWGNLEGNATEMANRAVKRYADREATLTQEKQELETSNAELNTQLNKLKGQHAKELEAKDTELATLKTTNAQLTAQLSELKTTNAQLATQLEELIALFATDKKPTARELKEKLKEARNQMIAINKLCGEDKLFTQEDYKDIKALEASNLEEGAKEIVSRALERFTTRLVAPYAKEIEDLKTTSAQKDAQIASYKDHLSPEQVEGKITATKEQYKDYLSPKAVQELKQKQNEALEAKDIKHAQDVANLKDQHTKELENLKQKSSKELEDLKTANANLETAHAQAVKDLKDQHAKEIEKGKQEHSTKEAQLTQERDKAISQLDSATKTAQELTDAKTKAETALADLQTTHKALETKYSALETSQTSNTPELEDLRQKHTKELEKLNTAHTKAVKDLNTASALKDKQIVELTAQKQKAEQETQALKTELESVKAEAKTIETFENKTTKLINKHIALITDLAENVNTKIQDTDNRVTKIHKQAQEEMIQQASNCALLNEELIANKFPKINATAILFGKGVKQEYTPSYDPIKAKSGYRELYRREQNIQDNLANTLKKDRQEAQTANNEAHKLILNATNSVATGINNLVIELKTSADYGMQLITTQTENARLTRENTKLKENLVWEQKRNKEQGDYIDKLTNERDDLKVKLKELQEQTKDDTPTPSKSKPTPKPTEPQKSPQPTQSTTPKKPLGM
ncbi:hypothetical protein, partial [Helicobacter ailurogastricus]|uniref:hypothetical protein n=1 Tax=Helicobacter ailurogastricus TaxID=1578720 RepID=UPI0025570050